MYKIAVLAGDGIGPEIVAQAVNVIKTAGEIFNTSVSVYHNLLLTNFFDIILNIS